MHTALWVALMLAAPTNAILITVDTLRADVLGYQGGPAQTPNFDALAQEGWNFEQCIAASMLTNPSHASLMTSLYPQDHGVYDNDSGIAQDTPTLAGALRSEGFHTGAVINFRHLNPSVSNLGQGFATVVPGRKIERRAAQVTAEALRLIDALPQPYFVWLHYTDPHAPYDAQAMHAGRAPSAAATSMQQARRAAPGFQRNNPWFREAFVKYGRTDALINRYLDEVEAVDTALGALRAGLTQRGLFDKTVWVVTADHGENLGEHALFFHHGGLYDSTVHVPLLLHAPGRAPTKRSGLVASVDIAPTLLQLLGVAPWTGMRGHSLVDYAQDAGTPRDFAFSEHMLGQLASVRSKEGTLIVHRQDSAQFPTYPFHRGRQEVIPADASAAVVEALSQALHGFMQAPRGQTARPAPAENREALRSLGYTE